MDFNDFIQENKRWLLCCLVGLLAYLIGSSIIDGRTDARSYRARLSKARTKIRSEAYRAPELREARADAEALDQKLALLRSKMVFTVPERFSLENKPDPQLHLQQVLAGERKRIQDLTYEHNIDLEDKAFDWSPPTEREQIERALVAVAMVAQVGDLLVAAHQKTKEADYGAWGVRSIKSFSTPRSNLRKRNLRRRNATREARDLISEIPLTVKFEADSRSLHQFLEGLRGAKNPLTIRSFKAKSQQRPGEPMQVDVVVVATFVQPISEEEN